MPDISFFSSKKFFLQRNLSVMKSEIAAAAASVAAQNLPVRPNYGCQVSCYHFIIIAAVAASVAAQNLPVRPNYGCQVSFYHYNSRGGC